MSSPAAIAERHSEMLSQFAEMAFELARDIQARALAADDAETAGRLAKDFHQVGRSLRQALALHARLQRDHAAIVEAHEARAHEAHDLRLIQRKTQVGKAAERMVWTEHEPEEAEFLVGLLPDLVDQLAEAADFHETPVEALVARIRRLLDADDDQPAEVELQSSA